MVGGRTGTEALSGPDWGVPIWIASIAPGTWLTDGSCRLPLEPPERSTVAPAGTLVTIRAPEPPPAMVTVVALVPVLTSWPDSSPGLPLAELTTNRFETLTIPPRSRLIPSAGW